MANKIDKQRIRPIVLGMARNKNKVLVAKGYDSCKKQEFYRFLGGGIEFGERIEDALRREFEEEIEEKIEVLKRICVVENIFTFENTMGHELVYVYEIKLPSEHCEKLIVV